MFFCCNYYVTELFSRHVKKILKFEVIMFYFFLCISLIIFSFGTFNAINMKRRGIISWQSFFLCMLVFTTFAMWVAVLPLIKEGGIIYKLLYAGFYTLESAVGNVDFSFFSEQFTTKLSFWRVYTILLHLLVPITAFGAILLYFINLVGWLRYTILRGNKHIIMFSNPSEKTKNYAKRIDKKDNLLIFCNTEDIDSEKFDDDSSRDMIFSRQNELQILRQIQKKNLTIMEMSDDEDLNLQKSIEIIRALESNNKEQTQSELSKKFDKKFKRKIPHLYANVLSEEDKKTIHIYTVTRYPEAATILDNLTGRGTTTNSLGIRHTIINEDKRIAFQLLFEHPLYKLVPASIDLDKSSQNQNKPQTLDIMIIGFGNIGQEVLKAISWAGLYQHFVFYFRFRFLYLYFYCHYHHHHHQNC